VHPDTASRQFWWAAVRADKRPGSSGARRAAPALGALAAQEAGRPAGGTPKRRQAPQLDALASKVAPPASPRASNRALLMLARAGLASESVELSPEPRGQAADTPQQLSVLRQQLAAAQARSGLQEDGSPRSGLPAPPRRIGAAGGTPADPLSPVLRKTLTLRLRDRREMVPNPEGAERSMNQPRGRGVATAGTASPHRRCLSLDVIP
jgi:hypothetical protein